MDGGSGDGEGSGAGGVGVGTGLGVGAGLGVGVGAGAGVGEPAGPEGDAGGGTDGAGTGVVGGADDGEAVAGGVAVDLVLVGLSAVAASRGSVVRPGIDWVRDEARLIDGDGAGGLVGESTGGTSIGVGRR